MVAGRARWLLGAALVALAGVLFLVARTLLSTEAVPEAARPQQIPAAQAPRAAELDLPTDERAPPAEPAPDPQSEAVPLAASGEAMIEPRQDVRVVVVDEAARPVPGATVQVLRRTSTPTLPKPHDVLGLVQEQRTDAQGRVTVLLDRKNDYVQASRAGLGRSSRAAASSLIAGRDLSGESVVRLRPDVVVQGRVRRADGQPAPGLAVEVRSLQRVNVGPPNEQSTTSAAPDGSFRFELESCEQVELAAIEADGARTERRLDVPADNRLDVTLDLPGAWWIRGVVLDEAGLPVPRAQVNIWQGTDLVDAWQSLAPGPERREPTRLHANLDGAFAHRATALEPHLLAAGRDVAGAVPSDPVLVVLTADRTSASATLRLPRPASVSGRVRTADGASVEGAGVFLRVAGPPSLQVIQPGMQATGQFNRREFAGEAITEADGRFVVQGLQPNGTFDLLVAPAGARGKDARQLALQDVAAWASDLDVVLPPGPPAKTGSLHLLVRSAITGQPATVRTYGVAPEGQAALALRTAPKDNGGDLVVGELVAGQEYAMTVSSKGLSTVQAHHLVAAESPALVTIDLPALGNLEVLVLDGQGQPLPHVQVRARRSEPGAGFRSPPTQTTNVDGLALFTELDAGSVRVTVTIGDTETAGTADVRPDATESLLIAVPRD